MFYFLIKQTPLIIVGLWNTTWIFSHTTFPKSKYGVKKLRKVFSIKTINNTLTWLLVESFPLRNCINRWFQLRYLFREKSLASQRWLLLEELQNLRINNARPPNPPTHRPTHRKTWIERFCTISSSRVVVTYLFCMLNLYQKYAEWFLL